MALGQKEAGAQGTTPEWQAGQADRVPVREIISQFEVVIPMSQPQEMRDSIEHYFKLREVKAEEAKSERQKQHIYIDPKDEPKIYVMFSMKDSTVKLSFKLYSPTDAEVLNVVNGVRELAGLTKQDVVEIEPEK